MWQYIQLSENIKRNTVLFKNMIVKTLVAKMSLFLKLQPSEILPWIQRLKIKQMFHYIVEGLLSTGSSLTIDPVGIAQW